MLFHLISPYVTSTEAPGVLKTQPLFPECWTSSAEPQSVCHKIMGFPSVTITILKSNIIFSQPQRLSRREDCQNQAAQGAELSCRASRLQWEGWYLQQIKIKQVISWKPSKHPQITQKPLRYVSNLYSLHIWMHVDGVTLLHLAGSSQRIWRSRQHVWVQRGTGGISPLPLSVWL